MVTVLPEDASGLGRAWSSRLFSISLACPLWPSYGGPRPCCRGTSFVESFNFCPKGRVCASSLGECDSPRGCGVRGAGSVGCTRLGRGLCAEGPLPGSWCPAQGGRVLAAVCVRGCYRRSPRLTPPPVQHSCGSPLRPALPPSGRSLRSVRVASLDPPLRMPGCPQTLYRGPWRQSFLGGPPGSGDH